MKMNREELTDYVLDFWLNWGVPEYDGTYESLYDEIYYNLNSRKGIESELDIVRMEFENGWDENSLEYKNLTDLWDNLNYYKSNFKEE